MLSKDAVNKEIVYNVLLVMSGILLEKNGERGINLYFSLFSVSSSIVFKHGTN